MTGMDVARLREVAEKATPGPWRAVEGDLEGKPPSEYLRTLLAKREKDGTSSGRMFLTLAPNDIDPELGVEVVPAMTGDGPRAEANAEHIATFDPPTVLALLDALADREARLAAVEALADAWDNPRWRGHDTAAPFARAIRRRLGPSSAALHPDPSEAAQGGGAR